MMRPPLAKKDSRENLSKDKEFSKDKETSIFNDDNSLKFSRAGGPAEAGFDLGFGNLDKMKSR